MTSENPRAAKLLLQPTFRQVNRRMKLRLLLRRVKLCVCESLAFLTKLAKFRMVAKSIAISGMGSNDYDVGATRTLAWTYIAIGWYARPEQ